MLQHNLDELTEVLSMFVLRASPVFLGEMNGTATALVRHGEGIVWRNLVTWRCMWASPTKHYIKVDVI